MFRGRQQQQHDDVLIAPFRLSMNININYKKKFKQLYLSTYKYHVVVVDPGTLAKCQCTPLPTRRYNHGEVASTILELHNNSIAAPLGAGVDCYLT